MQSSADLRLTTVNNSTNNLTRNINGQRKKSSTRKCKSSSTPNASLHKTNLYDLPSSVMNFVLQYLVLKDRIVFTSSTKKNAFLRCDPEFDHSEESWRSSILKRIKPLSVRELTRQVRALSGEFSFSSDISADLSQLDVDFSLFRIMCVQARFVSRLVSLKLSMTRTSNKFFAYLHSLPHLKHTTITVQDGSSLANFGKKKHPPFPLELDMRGTVIGIDCANQIAGSNQFRFLTSLKFSFSPFHPQYFRQVVDSTNVSALRSLSFTHYNGGINALVSTIANGAHLDSLTALDLSMNSMTSSEVREIVNSPKLKHLTELTLAYNSIGLNGVKEIAKGINSVSLTVLNLEGTRLTWPEATEIGNSTNLRSLTALNLSHNNIGIKGVRSIAKTANFALTSLDLSYNSLGEEEVKVIAEATRFASLKQLNLAHNRMGTGGATKLAKSTKLGSLTDLNLEANRISDSGALAIINSDNFGTLKTLNLGRSNITLEGLKKIVSSRNCRSIKDLSLHQNNLRDEGVRVIARSTNLTALEKLKLSTNSIYDEGFGAIADFKNFPCLSEIDLEANGISQTGPLRIAKAKFRLPVTLILDLNDIRKKDIDRIKNAGFIVK